MDLPVFINCRDRLCPLLELLSYLEGNCDRIYLLDNDSSYPPLLDYYLTTPHRLIRLGVNLGKHALWEADILARLGIDGPFVLTDPDVVPIAECPSDAIAYLHEVLEAYPDRSKAGLGLRIDDLPSCYRFRDDVAVWESQFWEKPLGPRLYDAPIDTTFAVIRAGTPPGIEGCVRTGYPYLARHLDWYSDTDHPTDEERYYREHARMDVSHWCGDVLPERLKEAIDHRRRLLT